jgi:hypothetical protein
MFKHNNIKIMDGEFLRKFGTRGYRAGQFDNPSGIFMRYIIQYFIYDYYI